MTRCPVGPPLKPPASAVRALFLEVSKWHQSSGAIQNHHAAQERHSSCEEPNIDGTKGGGAAPRWEFKESQREGVEDKWDRLGSQDRITRVCLPHLYATPSWLPPSHGHRFGTTVPIPKISHEIRFAGQKQSP